MGRKTEGKRVNDAQKHNLPTDGSFIETNPPLNECSGGGTGKYTWHARVGTLSQNRVGNSHLPICDMYVGT